MTNIQEVNNRGCKVQPTWRDGHVVLFRVAPSHRPYAVEAVGCDDGVGLGERCEGRRGGGGGLWEAQRRRSLRGRLGQGDVGDEVELSKGTIQIQLVFRLRPPAPPSSFSGSSFAPLLPPQPHTA